MAFAVLAYWFQEMRRWRLEWIRPKLTEYAARERAGEVVYDRPETFHRPAVTMLDHVSIEVDRFVRFFQVTWSAYSTRHNLIAVVYYVPLHLLALIGVADGLRGGDRRRSAAVQTALLWVVAMAALSALTTLDFDWRYRLLGDDPDHLRRRLWRGCADPQVRVTARSSAASAISDLG